ncbi:MAG: helix-hairpin-helix domain-containing protein [Candidatus Hodarchaeota archaeon]
MSLRNKGSRNKFRDLVVFIALVSLAVLLWQINTVLSVILTFGGIFVFFYNICISPLQAEIEGGRPRRSRYERMRTLRFDIGSLDDEMLKAVKLDETKDDYETFSVPVEDFEGDPLGLIHDIPVDVIKGIGEAHTLMMADNGVETLEGLADADPDWIASICGEELLTAEKWIFDAMAVIYGAGISSILELAMSDPDEILGKVELSIESGLIELPDDHDFNLRSAKHLIAEANRRIVLTPEDIKRWTRDRP